MGVGEDVLAEVIRFFNATSTAVLCFDAPPLNGDYNAPVYTLPGFPTYTLAWVLLAIYPCLVLLAVAVGCCWGVHHDVSKRLVYLDRNPQRVVSNSSMFAPAAAVHMYWLQLASSCTFTGKCCPNKWEVAACGLRYVMWSCLPSWCIGQFSTPSLLHVSCSHLFALPPPCNHALPRAPRKPAPWTSSSSAASCSITLM
jgi:hypothetical protein